MKEKEILSEFCKRLVALDMDIFGIAQDAAVWRTIGAKGNRHEGREGGSRVLIEEGTGQILGGLGGKYTGMTVGEMKQKSKQQTKQKQAAAINAKAQQKAYGKGMHDAQNAATQVASASAAALASSMGADPAEQKIMEIMKQMDALADKYEASSNAEEQAQIEKEFDKLTEEMHKAAEQTQTGKAKPQPKTKEDIESELTTLTKEKYAIKAKIDKLEKKLSSLPPGPDYDLYETKLHDQKMMFEEASKKALEKAAELDKFNSEHKQTSSASKTYASFEDTPEAKKLKKEYNKLVKQQNELMYKKLKMDAKADPQAYSDITKQINDMQTKIDKTLNDMDVAETAWTNSSLVQQNKNDATSTASSLASYETPYGKKSPIPSFLPHGSVFVHKLKDYNFPTGDNEVGYDAKKPWNKQGFAQTKIPTEQDLKSSGFYADGTPPSGYWDGVPHLKNPHPDMKKIGKSKVMECDDYTDDGMLNVYRHRAHNNVPFASAYNSAAGQAAAYSYTACSNTLNDTLRFGVNTQSGKLSSDKQKWSEDTALVTKELDKMLSVSRTKEPLTVYRGNDFISEEQFYNDYKKGKVLEDKGFMSTSINPRKSSSFAASTWGLFKIRVPAGASAVSLRYTKDGKHGFSAYDGEDEILLPRNTKYKIVGFEEGKGALAKYKKIPIVEIVQE